MKRILIFSSDHTGAGHRSITEALTEQFSAFPDVEVQVVEGFETLGRSALFIASLYGFLPRRAPGLYNAAWRYSMANPPPFLLTSWLYDRPVMRCVRRYRPDMILTVHSLFNTLMTRILKRHGLDIPVMVLEADPVHIHSTWCNPNAYMTLCPTREAYEATVAQGVPAEKVKVLGFPIRRRFCDAGRSDGGKDREISRPARCLLVSGAEGCGRLRAYSEVVLGDTDVSLTVVCGRNARLQRQLQEDLCDKYGDRVQVLGFVPDMEQLMLRSDLLISRGSPNTLLEAVTLCLPVIMIGPLPEQEKGTPRLMASHGLGVACDSPSDAAGIIRGLLENDAARLREIRAAQRAFRRFDAAHDIAAFAAEQVQALPSPWEEEAR